jgi:hypothetical protein
MRPDRRRVSTFAAGFMLLAGAVLPALELAVDRVAFLPASFGAGESVEAILLVHPVEGEAPAPFTLRAGEGLPQPGPGADPELREARLQRGPGGLELRLFFTPWSPGRGAIPAFSARGVLVPRLPYEARTVLAPGERDPAPPKPPREPPGSFLALYGIAGLFVILALLCLAALSRILPAARALLERRRAAQALRGFQSKLEFLREGLAGRKGLDPLAAAAFYAALARGLRLYLAARVLPEAPALTPPELRGLPESSFPAPGLRDLAAALLAEADAVRFGGAEARPASMLAAIDQGLSLARGVEEVLLDRL